MERRLQTYNWLINDPLSNKGLKVFIFDSMMEAINNALKRYANKIGFKIILKVDLNSARKSIDTFIYAGDTMIPYEDLSGGQSQLIHVAIAFAISDVVDGDTGCNLLILDEIFESLSAENVDLVSDLIVLKSHNKSVHLITHLEKFNPTNSRLIRLGLVKGSTKAL